MKFQQIIIAVIVAAAVSFGWKPASYGSTSAQISLGRVMGSAILKAERVERENPPANATDAQLQQLDNRKAAALSHLRSTLVGRKLVAVFTVTDVSSGYYGGGFEVDGTINWHQPARRDRAVREAIAEVNKRYGPEGARRMVKAMVRADAPPPQRISVHEAPEAVLVWKRGQIRTVFGRVTSVEAYCTSDDYDDDYVACEIGMRWVADHAPHAAEGKARVKNEPSPAEFVIVLKNGSTVHATSCVKHGHSYWVVESGVQANIPSASVVSVTELSVPPGK